MNHIDSSNIKEFVCKEIQAATIKKQKPIVAHTEQLCGLLDRESFNTEILGSINAKLNQFTIHLIELEAELKEAPN